MKKTVETRSHHAKVVTIQEKDLMLAVGAETTPWGDVNPDPPVPNPPTPGS